jgi:hypothetical protein
LLLALHRGVEHVALGIARVDREHARRGAPEGLLVADLVGRPRDPGPGARVRGALARGQPPVDLAGVHRAVEREQALGLDVQQVASALVLGVAEQVARGSSVRREPPRLHLRRREVGQDRPVLGREQAGAREQVARAVRRVALDQRDVPQELLDARRVVGRRARGFEERPRLAGAVEIDEHLARRDGVLGVVGFEFVRALEVRHRRVVSLSLSLTTPR